MPYVPMVLPPQDGIPAGDWSRGNPMNGAPYLDDDPIMSIMDDPKPKKSKNGNKDTSAKAKANEHVGTQLVGYTLEKVPPRRGENLSWQRVGQRTLPIDENKLKAMVKEHRLRTRRGPSHDFLSLTGAQQGVVSRLIAQRKLEEKNPNADWILVDVQRHGQWHWSSLDVRRIQVILKRHDKSLTKPKDPSLNPDLGGYQEFEIIDLAEPVKEKKRAVDKKTKDGKKPKKVDSFDDLALLDDPIGLRIPAPQTPQQNDHNQQQQYREDDRYQDDRHQLQEQSHGLPHSPQNQQQPQYIDPFGAGGLGMPLPPPPGGIPIDPNFRPPGADNPFIPHPQLMPPPGQYDPALLNNPDFRQQHPPRMIPRPPPTITPGHQREPSRLRRSSSASRRERELKHEMAELRDQLERQQLNKASDHSGSSRYSPESVFSRPSAGEPFTPPSTPPRSPRSVEFQPRGSLHQPRKGSRELRERRYGPRHYKDEEFDIQLAYNRRPRREYSPPDERRPRSYREARPKIHHAHTYHDDYPRPEREMRYLPQQAPRIQRRLTEGGQGWLVDAEFDGLHRRRQEARRRGGGFEERPEPVYERRKGPKRVWGDGEGYLR